MIFTVELLRYEKILASPAVSKLKPGLATYFMGPSENENVRLFFFFPRKAGKKLFSFFCDLSLSSSHGCFFFAVLMSHTLRHGVLVGWVSECSLLQVGVREQVTRSPGQGGEERPGDNSLHAPLSCQTSFRKHRFKDKVNIKKMVTTASSPSVRRSSEFKGSTYVKLILSQDCKSRSITQRPSGVFLPNDYVIYF